MIDKMVKTNKAIVIEGIDRKEFDEMSDRMRRIEEAVLNFKIPDPSAEKLFKAKEFDAHFSISRSKGQDARKTLIARGLLRPVEISPGVFRYRRSELLALDFKDLK